MSNFDVYSHHLQEVKKKANMLDGRDRIYNILSWKRSTGGRVTRHPLMLNAKNKLYGKGNSVPYLE